MYLTCRRCNRRIRRSKHRLLRKAEQQLPLLAYSREYPKGCVKEYHVLTHRFQMDASRKVLPDVQAGVARTDHKARATEPEGQQMSKQPTRMSPPARVCSS